VVSRVQKRPSRIPEVEFAAGIQSLDPPPPTHPSTQEDNALSLLRSVINNNHHIYKIHSVDGIELTTV
jgi:hypothetical protein